MENLLSRKPFFSTLVVSFCLLFADYQYHLTQPLQYALNQSVVLPARRVLGLPVAIYEYLSENLLLYSTLIRERHDLKTTNAELQVRLGEFEALQLENQSLRTSLEYQPDAERAFLPAEIVQILFRQNRAILVIDRNQSDGIEIDQVVVDRQGLIGRIIAVFQNNSHVQMLSDNKHYISAYTEGGVHTIVQGRGVGSDLAALYIPNFAHISPGEEIYSSGLEDIYPARFPIGRIRSVENDIDDDFSTVFVTPHANLQSNRDLYILTDPKTTPAKVDKK